MTAKTFAKDTEFGDVVFYNGRYLSHHLNTIYLNSEDDEKNNKELAFYDLFSSMVVLIRRDECLELIESIPVENHIPWLSVIVTYDQIGIYLGNGRLLTRCHDDHNKLEVVKIKASKVTILPKVNLSFEHDVK